MSFLRRSDFSQLMQQQHLAEVMQSNPEVLFDNIESAEAEVKSYLRGVYDVDVVFAEYEDYDADTEHAAGDHVWFSTTATIDGASVATDRLYKALSVVQGELPSDTEFWVIADPRDRLIQQITIDVTLYHLHSTISPNNIPELRVTRYERAIAMLKQLKSGELSTDLPQVEQPTTSRTIIASQAKNNWHF